ncbi:MAG: lytic transglycosylase domain-containing protein [bacterium]|nr:lytic transglycosylase domain-containing protein [bacterium]
MLRCLSVFRDQRFGRRPGLPFRMAMAACLLLGAACASPPPTGPSLAPVPPTVSLPPPSRAPEAAPPPAALAPEPVVPEPVDPLLATVEAVLVERAPALSEAERAATAAEIVVAEREHDLPALLLLAVIEHESRFDPTAKSRRGALGLMQIRPFVGADVAYRHHLPFHRTPDLFQPQLNVAIGIRFLAELHEEFGDLELALAAYHIGPTRVRARVKRGWRPRGPYVRTVMSRYHALRRDTGELATAIGG